MHLTEKPRSGTDIKQDCIQEEKNVTRIIKIFFNSLTFLSLVYLFNFQVLCGGKTPVSHPLILRSSRKLPTAFLETPENISLHPMGSH